MRGQNFFKSLVVILLAGIVGLFSGCAGSKAFNDLRKNVSEWQAKTDAQLAGLAADANQSAKTLTEVKNAADPAKINQRIVDGIAPLCKILECYTYQPDANKPVEIRSARFEKLESDIGTNSLAIEAIQQNFATKDFVANRVKTVQLQQSRLISRSQFDRALLSIAEREKNLVRIVSGGDTITAYLEFAPYQSALTDEQKKQIHEEIVYMIVYGERLSDMYELIDLKGYYSPGGPEENLAIARAEAVFNELKDEHQNLSIHSIVKPTLGGLGRREVRMIFKNKKGGQTRTQGNFQM